MGNKTAIKKIFFVGLLFIITPLVTSAQNEINWSIKAGIGMANLTGDYMESSKIRLAYKFGIGLDCPLGQVWSLQTGISFVSKGTNHTYIEGNGVSAQAQVNALYLELPLMVAARLAINRNTKIVVSAGPYGAWGVGGKTKAVAYSWSSSSSRPNWDEGKVTEMYTFDNEFFDLRHFDYGVGAGIAVEYRRYILGIEGQMGLGKLQRELGAKNLTGFVTAGYKF